MSARTPWEKKIAGDRDRTYFGGPLKITHSPRANFGFTKAVLKAPKTKIRQANFQRETQNCAKFCSRVKIDVPENMPSSHVRKTHPKSRLNHQTRQAASSRNPCSCRVSCEISRVQKSHERQEGTQKMRRNITLQNKVFRGRGPQINPWGPQINWMYMDMDLVPWRALFCQKNASRCRTEHFKQGNPAQEKGYQIQGFWGPNSLTCRTKFPDLIFFVSIPIFQPSSALPETPIFVVFFWNFVSFTKISPNWPEMLLRRSATI